MFSDWLSGYIERSQFLEELAIVATCVCSQPEGLKTSWNSLISWPVYIIIHGQIVIAKDLKRSCILHRLAIFLQLDTVQALNTNKSFTQTPKVTDLWIARFQTPFEMLA